MAHASSLEKAKLQMKKVRKGRSRLKQEDAKLREEMTETEYDAYILKKTSTRRMN